MPSPASTPKLSLSQLQTLASQCGISKTGPRAALTQRLSDTLHNHKPLSAKTRVLSIDLGIRNLAFTLLTKPSSASSKPIIHAWQRLDLAPSAGAKIAKAKLEDGEPGPPPAVPQDFSPTALSAVALRLVKDHLLPLNPTHVVIERQRFRSGGGAAVFEWTVRVNSLESMLYAVFATMKGLGRWDGVVESVDPKRVGPFLLGEGEATQGGLLDSGSPQSRRSKEEGADEEVSGKTKNAKKTPGKENKKLKIDLLGKWLVAGTDVQIDSPEAKATRAAFLTKWLPKEKAAKGEKASSSLRTVETMKKLDDVTDSLLQGVAWLRWQENKQSMLEEYRDRLS